MTSAGIFGSILPIIEVTPQLSDVIIGDIVFFLTTIPAILGYKYGAKIIKPLLKHLVKKFVL